MSIGHTNTYLQLRSYSPLFALVYCTIPSPIYIKRVNITIVKKMTFRKQAISKQGFPTFTLWVF